MKTLFTFCISLITLSAMAQIPTNFGSNAEDGITYQTYNLIDHGVVSSVRFQAQNAIPEGQGTWEFYTGSYDPVWRPYTANDTLSGFDAIIDPSIETASARYNTQVSGGGATGLLPAIQAGYYYTAIIQDGAGDNFMSIIETDFAPVAIDTVYITPTNPTSSDAITFTVELNQALVLSPGEHVFIRASPDFNIQSSYLEVTNFSGGVGTATIPAGSVPSGIPIQYYALVTEEVDPEAVADIDYFTLFFANNGGNNYEFTVSEVTGIEAVAAEFDIVTLADLIRVQNADGLTSIELVSIDGKLVRTIAVNSSNSVNINTSDLKEGIYVLNLISREKRTSTKVVVR